MQIHLPEIWIIIGFICILLEFVLPGAIIVFLGTAAIATGILLKIGLSESYGIPLFVFMALAAGQIFLLRRHFQGWFKGKTVDGNVDGLDDFLGKQATVVKGFEEGSHKGTVQFKGANWKAVSEDPLKAGQDVVIVKQEGITLYVAPLR